MIEKEGIDYTVLVRSTQLYYATRTSYAVAIGKFITEGMWRTGYDSMKDKPAEELLAHIKSEIDGHKQHSHIRSAFD